MELTRENFVDPLGGECDDIEETHSTFKGMRKMSKKDEEKFPSVVVGSIRCQMYYDSKCERCNGCEFAVDGCEKIVAMSAG